MTRDKFMIDLPMDEKLKSIKNLLNGFFIFETNDGLLEARLDYDYFTQFVGNCVYHSELIDVVYDHLYGELDTYLCI